MLIHVSQTKTLQKFSRAQQHQQEAPKQPVSNNVLEFPSPNIRRSTKAEKQEVLDWKERLITKKQFNYIRILAWQNGIRIQKLNSDCFRQYGADLATMKRTDASDVIHSLQRSLRILIQASCSLI